MYAAVFSYEFLSLSSKARRIASRKSLHTHRQPDGQISHNLTNVFSPENVGGFLKEPSINDCIISMSSGFRVQTTMHLHMRSPTAPTLSLSLSHTHTHTHTHKQLFTFGRIHIYIGPLNLRKMEHMSVTIQGKYEVMIVKFLLQLR